MVELSNCLLNNHRSGDTSFRCYASISLLALPRGVGALYGTGKTIVDQTVPWRHTHNYACPYRALPRNAECTLFSSTAESFSRSLV